MRTHSESGLLHLGIMSAPQTGSISTSEEIHTAIKPAEQTSSESKNDDLTPSISSHLAEHVLLWHTIQQQLATNLLIHQRQDNPATITNPLQFMSSSLARSFQQFTK